MFARALSWALCALLAAPCFATTVSLDFTSNIDPPIGVTAGDAYTIWVPFVGFMNNALLGPGVNDTASVEINFGVPLRLAQASYDGGGSVVFPYVFNALCSPDLSAIDLAGASTRPVVADHNCYAFERMTLNAYGGVDEVSLAPLGAIIQSVTLDLLTPGDSDRDGDVDLVDLNEVRNNFGQSSDFILAGDVTFDGIIDLADLNAVRNNFGANVALAVPEPSTLALMLGCYGVVAICRSCRPGRHLEWHS